MFQSDRMVGTVMGVRYCYVSVRSDGGYGNDFDQNGDTVMGVR